MKNDHEEEPRIKEKRKAKRVSCERPIDIQSANAALFKGAVRDLSLKGAFIYKEKGLDVTVGDEVEFDIALSETNPDHNVCGEAKVVRKDLQGGVAIEFTIMDEGDLARLREFLSLNLGEGDLDDADLHNTFEG